jgi:hypothetical protein
MSRPGAFMLPVGTWAAFRRFLRTSRDRTIHRIAVTTRVMLATVIKVSFATLSVFLAKARSM